MVVIGVDPGASGALCSLDSCTKEIKFHSTPQSKNLFDSIGAILNWLSTQHIPTIVAIEDVHSMGGMSAKSNFQFGRNLGLIEALIHSWSNQVEYVQPKVWQKACGISFIYPERLKAIKRGKIRKMTTAARALELYPGADIYGPKGGLKDGRSDALMIAHYLTLKYGDENGPAKT